MGLGIESLDPGSQLLKGSCDATNQGRGGVFFLFADIQIIQLDHNLRKSLRANADVVAAIQHYICHRFQIYCGGQHTATLVIGMITANLCTAGSGDQKMFFVI